MLKSDNLAEKHRRAIAFYATDDRYAAAVMVFVYKLRKIGFVGGADIVVLHLQLSPRIVAGMQQMGIVTTPVSDVPPAYGQYYEHCLLKLKILELTRYDLVIYVDADSIPLKTLDPLFTFHFDGPIAAPRAYWLPQPFWGSYLMLVKPSAELWGRAQQHFAMAARKPYYDMDIINAEFGSEITPLADDLVYLNTEWEDKDRRGIFEDPNDAYSKVSVVHFSALGKPWSYYPGATRSLRPNAHPIFHDLYAEWWNAWREVYALYLDRSIASD